MKTSEIANVLERIVPGEDLIKARDDASERAHYLSVTYALELIATASQRAKAQATNGGEAHHKIEVPGNKITDFRNAILSPDIQEVLKEKKLKVCESSKRCGYFMLHADIEPEK